MAVCTATTTISFLKTRWLWIRKIPIITYLSWKLGILFPSTWMKVLLFANMNTLLCPVSTNVSSLPRWSRGTGGGVGTVGTNVILGLVVVGVVGIGVTVLVLCFSVTSSFDSYSFDWRYGGSVSANACSYRNYSDSSCFTFKYNFILLTIWNNLHQHCYKESHF